jgi:hypothetical protein
MRKERRKKCERDKGTKERGAKYCLNVKEGIDGRGKQKNESKEKLKGRQTATGERR